MAFDVYLRFRPLFADKCLRFVDYVGDTVVPTKSFDFFIIILDRWFVLKMG